MKLTEQKVGEMNKMAAQNVKVETELFVTVSNSFMRIIEDFSEFSKTIQAVHRKKDHGLLIEWVDIFEQFLSIFGLLFNKDQVVISKSSQRTVIHVTHAATLGKQKRWSQLKFWGCGKRNYIEEKTQTCQPILAVWVSI